MTFYYLHLNGSHKHNNTSTLTSIIAFPKQVLYSGNKLCRFIKYETIFLNYYIKINLLLFFVFDSFRFNKPASGVQEVYLSCVSSYGSQQLTEVTQHTSTDATS